MHKEKSLKDPQVGSVECGYGDGDAQAAGKARRHLDCLYEAAFGARTSVLSAAHREVFGWVLGVWPIVGW
jgi:hypothetical protein